MTFGSDFFLTIAATQKYFTVRADVHHPLVVGPGPVPVHGPYAAVPGSRDLICSSEARTMVRAIVLV